MAISVLIIAAAITLGIFYAVRLISFLINRRKIRKILQVIPGQKTIPVFDNAITFLVGPEKIWSLMRKMNVEYYPIFKILTPRYDAVNLRHPDDAEILLSSQKHITKGEIYHFLHPWFGTGLLTSTGNKWQTRRKILTPAFHFNVLREFSQVFDQEGRRMVENLKLAKGDTTVDLVSFTAKYTLNTICETAMGTSLTLTAADSENFQKVYRHAIHTMGEVLLHRLFRPWLHNNLIFYMTRTGMLHKKCLQIIQGFSKKIIKERQQYHEDTKGVHLDELQQDNFEYDNSFQSTSKRRLAMLDLLIAAMKKNGSIDDNGIAEEVDTFMFEGHDTTAMGLTFSLLLLAEHKDIQERARAEVDEMMKNCDGRVGINELQQLSYLERCIKEALRLYPSVPFISRNIREDLQLKKYLLPAGIMAHLHIYDLHRDPNFWPDPLRYDPDRFLPENITGRHPFSYIPFSGGPRNCIGQKFAMMELKTLIGYLLHNFYLEPVDFAAEVQILSDLVLRPKGSVQVKFKPR